MKKLGLGQSIGILANIGVIAGIVFLGVELRQNNELMAAEARFNRVMLSNEGWRILAENGDLTELRVRAWNSEALTEAEQVRVDAAAMRVLVNLEWMYRELPPESSERDYLRDQLRNSFSLGPTTGRVWEQRKAGFDRGFVRFVEENIVDVAE